MSGWNGRRFAWRDELEPIAGKYYSIADLDAMTTAILREDARRETCPTCGVRGERAGLSFGCDNGHAWKSGEGERRGVKGDNAVLLDDHLQARRSREVYSPTGDVDPSVVSGNFHRSHRDGHRTARD